MRVGIIGAGPAGLTAGYLLKKSGVDVTIFEADPEYVGGISRTAKYKGYLFDIGGHRFFSKSQKVEDFWSEILPQDMLVRPRSSRIYYGKQFYSYPLRAGEALKKMGIFRATQCVLSYAWAKLFPVKNPNNFEDWVCNNFGRKLFTFFFKTYTEKVWGMNCRDISSDWAAQRIQGLSLWSAIVSSLRPIPTNQPKNQTRVIKTLINSFRYPRKGPGMMWEACAKKIKGLGGNLHMGAKVNQCIFDRKTSTWKIIAKTADTQTIEQEFDHIISSAPMRELALALEPKLPSQLMEKANHLKYRDFLTVVLILKERNVFDDNWIYIHDPSVKVGRVQNFKSWSPEMVPDPSMCCYGLEYFCWEGDGLWTESDKDLILRGAKEMKQIGLIQSESEVIDGCVVRQVKAYPVYDEGYAKRVSELWEHLDSYYPNLHVAGRNGMHKYNNQDHAMMTAMLTVENILAGRKIYDVWQVNQDAEYHEQGSIEKDLSSGLRMVPTKVKQIESSANVSC